MLSLAGEVHVSNMYVRALLFLHIPTKDPCNERSRVLSPIGLAVLRRCCASLAPCHIALQGLAFPHDRCIVLFQKGLVVRLLVRAEGLTFEHGCIVLANKLPEAPFLTQLAAF